MSMFYVVCFDISDDRTRYRVAKVLKGYGYRVQKSVFECPRLTEKKLLTLMDRVDRLIDHTTDTVRFYRQCEACLKSFEHVGLGLTPERQSYGAV
ncbi:CRISPR-associated endonuclease Cas2 [Desulfosoma caldarium]|uniref:CRISPR-associated endoribonuclease Cas2 n=1 Tax=Desulfosoma caldarium TaxID=610254 RepID=A0A3N1ULE6_9BACT|nr:CRISPR-associated endonuclease Cas2 [Desulfosoma caldarium]ROQ92054.1 CRISPR-associated Cas2 family protein [Desulfosoma caldarium]